MSEYDKGTVCKIVSKSRYEGEVAVAVRREGEEQISWVVPAAEHAQSMAYADRELRPLVVIDPEDRDAVARLYDLYASAPSDVGLRGHEFLAHALREFANPKPPKPEEPAGLGAIVEDADGNPWVKTLPGIDKDAFEWIAGFPSDSKLVAYKDIDAVKVLSPGVE